MKSIFIIVKIIKDVISLYHSVQLFLFFFIFLKESNDLERLFELKQLCTKWRLLTDTTGELI